MPRAPKQFGFDSTSAQVLFASFGSTAGSCATGFREGLCNTTGKIGNANCSMDVVAHACIGKASCAVPATVETFGQPCPRVVKSLAAEVHCSGGAAQPPGSCQHSCYDEPPAPTPTPTPTPAPAPTPGAAPTTPAQRFNAVVAATRSTAIGNYVMGARRYTTPHPYCLPIPPSPALPNDVTD
eukprot:COSAG05_NODE_3_length_51333_cov_129.132080_9_plen_182_part_00